MSFIQIINFKSDRIDEIEQMRGDWINRSAGDRSAIELHIGQNRDVENAFTAVVLFPSYEEAMENSSLPATQEFAAKMTKLCLEPPQYVNLDVIEAESFLNRKG